MWERVSLYMAKSYVAESVYRKITWAKVTHSRLFIKAEFLFLVTHANVQQLSVIPVTCILLQKRWALIIHINTPAVSCENPSYGRDICTMDQTILWVHRTRHLQGVLLLDTGPYSEPHDSHYIFLPSSLKSTVMLSCHLCLGLQDYLCPCFHFQSLPLLARVR